MKGDAAFRTISEVTAETGVAPHVLRYWETRFPQLRPMQRAGNRRYYRPADVALVRRIDALLNQQGYTVKGVQKLLAEGPAATPEVAPLGTATVEKSETSGAIGAPDRAVPLLNEVRAIRDALAAALADDRDGPTG